MAAQSSGNPTGTKWDDNAHCVIAEFSTGRKVSVHFNEDEVLAGAPDGIAKKTEVQRLIRHYRENGTAAQLLAIEQVDSWHHLDRRNVDVMRMIVNFVGSVGWDVVHAEIGRRLNRGDTSLNGSTAEPVAAEPTEPTEPTEPAEPVSGSTAPAEPTEPAAAEPAAAPSPLDALEQRVREIADEQIDRADIGLSADELQSIIGDVLAEAVANIQTRPKTIEIVTKEPRPIQSLNTDKLHKDFDEVLKQVAKSEGLGVYLVGPAGTGKTYLCKQVAEALGLALHTVSMGAAMTASAFFGYKQPTNGEYVSTPVRDWYQNGGILLLDEVDAGHPGMLVVLNKLLSDNAGSVHPFPDGDVVKHDDCLVVATANTFGTGPDRMYVGRNALDAATISRFAYTHDLLPDTELEAALGAANCVQYGGTEEQGRDWAALVDRARQAAYDSKLPVVIGQRDVIAGARWIADPEESMQSAAKITFLARLNEQQLTTSGIKELV